MIKIDNTLFFRRIEKSDLPYRVDWINDPDINRTLTFSTPVSMSSTEKWFEISSNDNTKLNLTFFIKENQDFIPIAFGGFINVDLKNSRAELFVTIGNKDYHGKGIGKKIVSFLVSYGFEELNLNKVYLTTLDNNERAKLLYERCGFTVDGKLRKHFYHKGQFRDCYHMSILRDNTK
ncbi:TPA: N-acetyltransferase [Vibrio vulnificus]|nr:GNAT family protein [Vibrio vulnificus]HAS8600274.1 N-acetyltransferase [Vibrio vulnificus]